MSDTRGMKARALGVGFALAALATASSCSMKAPSDIPPAPPEVRQAIRDVDVAVAGVAGDPNGFVREALDKIPALQEALDAWAAGMDRIVAARAIHGWSLEAGIVLTGLQALPDPATAADCGPMVAAWKRLRSALP